MTQLAALLTQEETGGMERLVQFGVLGIVAVLFITDRIVTGAQYRKLEAKNEALQSIITDRVIPLLERVARVLEQNNDIVVQLVKDGRVRITPDTSHEQKDNP